MSYNYIVYCKRPDDGRGEYSEEIDVTTKRRSAREATQIAQAILDKEYVEGMRAVRAIPVPEGYTIGF